MFTLTLETRKLDIHTDAEIESESYQLRLANIFQGEPGEDAKINGHNAVTLDGDGERVTVTPDEDEPTKLRISIDVDDKIGDAPSDGKQYARKDGQWSEVLGGGGASTYADLPDKPSINGTTLSGNKTAAQLGLEPANPNIVKDADYVHTDNNFTDSEKQKLGGLENYDDTAIKGRVTTIEGKIPSQASASNQLADKDFVNSSIQNVAAYYITKDAAGNPFATKAELLAATTFYSGGQVRVPTRNDYLVVLADESKTISETGENPTTRYIYDNDVWSYQYIVNRSGLTAAQWAAVNSGITAAEVTRLAGLTDKVFLAEYNVTTYADIAAAADAGKVVICKYNSAVYVLSYKDAERVTFVASQNDGIRWLGLGRLNEWMSGNTDFTNFELGANKTTTLSASSTNSQYPSAKATYDAINPAKQSAIPSGGMLPNVLYALGELSGTVTMSLATPADANICNHYFFTFSTGTTAPTITWDSKITSWQGGSAPTINASKHYEVSVLNGVGVIMEV